MVRTQTGGRRYQGGGEGRRTWVVRKRGEAARRPQAEAGYEGRGHVGACDVAGGVATSAFQIRTIEGGTVQEFHISARQCTLSPSSSAMYRRTS